MKFCKTESCHNTVKNGAATCSTCRARKTKLKDPVKYAFTNLKSNAKRRGKEFTLTLEEFRTWAVKVNYVGFAKGRSATGYNVDRIKEGGPYSLDNIQLITKRENIKKFFYYDFYRRTAVFITETKADYDKDLPF